MKIKSLRLSLFLINFLLLWTASSFGALREFAEQCFRQLPEYAEAQKKPWDDQEKSSDNQHNSFLDKKNIFANEEYYKNFKNFLKEYNAIVKNKLSKGKNWFNNEQGSASALNLPKLSSDDDLEPLINNTDPLPYLQRITIQPESKFFFAGNFYGSIHSLLRTLLRLEKLKYLDEDLNIIRNDFKMVFLGNYFGKGRYSCEILYILLALATKNPGKVFLLKGSQEYGKQSIKNGFLGFYDPLDTKDPKFEQKKIMPSLRFDEGEFSRKFGEINVSSKVCKILTDIILFFNSLPLALVIETQPLKKTKEEKTETITQFDPEELSKDEIVVKKRNRIFCCHGGISKKLMSHEFINFLNSDKKFMKIALDNGYSGFVSNGFVQCVPRSPDEVKKAQAKIEKSRAEMADEFYEKSLKKAMFKWKYEGPSEKGVSRQASVSYAEDYLMRRGLDVFVCGSQAMAFGCKMFFGSNKIKLETEKIKETRKRDLKVLKDKKFLKEEDKKYKKGFYPYGPFCWKHVLSEEDLTENETNDGFLMNRRELLEGVRVPVYAPIFTFSSAPEGRGQDGIDVDCFGIMKVKEKYDECRLKVYEFKLDKNRNGKYVLLKNIKAEPDQQDKKKDLFAIEWVDKKPDDNEKAIQFELQKAEKKGLLERIFGKKEKGKGDKEEE